jgi:hypothetical protein
MALFSYVECRVVAQRSHYHSVFGTVGFGIATLIFVVTDTSNYGTMGNTYLQHYINGFAALSSVCSTPCQIVAAFVAGFW